MLKRKSLVSITSVFMALLMVMLSVMLPVSASISEAIDNSEEIVRYSLGYSKQ